MSDAELLDWLAKYAVESDWVQISEFDLLPIALELRPDLGRLGGTESAHVIGQALREWIRREMVAEGGAR